ncbi:hypothetical protein [Corynebacterium cystitidis]|uniref:Secreted protein n=1 Tax=Corynebacterium cystitidis DSM 20524 TaxID=1121357 RepID=A0A1H9NYX1_9CORY|nr:hypothetical protein [Corynebacterium cystitidis]WJY82673.1 hypothetical protein CCYS_08795 [Corynebacterium cystitidis DSM 20524]SER41224.1 hypothetical protein SAMN05661109_00158 [Corynebacterium cystitidis DSM 20524]SNV71987.1 or membrane protein [Corynebacterium cystitidis]
MRKFRNAALAVATATTVAFAGVSVASAQEPSEQPEKAVTAPENDGKPGENGSTNPVLSSGSSQPGDADADKLSAAATAGLSSKNPNLAELGKVTGADQHANALDLLGSSVDDTKNPQWSRIWRDAANWAAIAAALGGVIAAYNYAVFQGIIPHAIQF